MSKLEAGRYQGRARNVMSVGTATSGSLRVAVTLDLTNQGYEDRSVTWFGSLGASDEADKITVRQLRAMGWKGTSLDDSTGLGDEECAIAIEYERYNGRDTMRVQVFPLQRETFQFDKPAERGAVSAMNAKLKGLFVQSLNKGGATKPAAAPAFSLPSSTPAQPPPVSASVGGDDFYPADDARPSAQGDDIPF